MDVFTLITKLRKARRRHTLSSGAQALFYELVAICNEERWSGVFICPNGELCSAINVAEKTLIKFRDELAAAELLTYKSGKSKKEPCSYSFNGSLKGLPIDLLNGGKIYSRSGSQSVSQTGEKSTDLLIHKTEEEDKRLLEDYDIKSLARKKLIEEAIDECREVDKTGNVAFPEQAHLSEKEKNCAKKEKKPLPSHEEAVEKVAETAHWWNVVQFYLSKDLLARYTNIKWEDIPEVDKKPLFDQREKLFEKFYATKRDNYLIRLPPWKEVAENFYYWVPSELNREKLQQLNNHVISKSRTVGTHNAKNNATVGRIERNNSVENLAQKSEEFLQQYFDEEHG